MNHEQRPLAMIEALVAPGPAPEYADKLALFGRLVGAWDLDATAVKNSDAPPRVTRPPELG